MKKNRWQVFTVCVMLCAAFVTRVAGEGPAKPVRDAAAVAGRTVVTSDRLEFDYKRNIALFEGNVKVRDPEIRMEADRLSMTLNEDKSVKLARATGNVKVWYQDKVAMADQVVYRGTETGTVELLGNAVLSRGVDTVKGTRIVFWLHEDRMTCEPADMLILTPDTRPDPKKAVPDAKP